MLYSISEIAKILGFTRQGVYNKIKRLSSDLQPFIIKKQGVTYINDEGLEIIRKDLIIEKELTSVKTTVNDFKEVYIQGLKDQITKLENKLDEKDEIIKGKDERLKQQEQSKDELIKNFQILLKQEQDRVLQIEGEFAAAKEEPKGFWTRLFRK